MLERCLVFFQKNGWLKVHNKWTTHLMYLYFALPCHTLHYLSLSYFTLPYPRLTRIYSSVSWIISPCVDSNGNKYLEKLLFHRGEQGQALLTRKIDVQEDIQWGNRNYSRDEGQTKEWKSDHAVRQTEQTRWSINRVVCYRKSKLKEAKTHQPYQIFR